MILLESVLNESSDNMFSDDEISFLQNHHGFVYNKAKQYLQKKYYLDNKEVGKIWRIEKHNGEVILKNILPDKHGQIKNFTDISDFVDYMKECQYTSIELPNSYKQF